MIRLYNSLTNKIEELLNEIVSKSVEVDSLLDTTIEYYMLKYVKPTEEENDSIERIVKLRDEIVEMWK